MKQVDKMRELYKLYAGQEAKVIEAYALAEDRGEVERNSNTYGYSNHEYARRLFYNTFKRKQ